MSEKTQILYLRSVYYIVVCSIIMTFTSYCPEKKDFDFQKQSPDIIIKSVDPLIKITGDFSSNVNETTGYDVARGENVHIQLAVWNKSIIKNFAIQYNSPLFTKISGITIQRVGYVSIKQPASALKNKITSAANKFPDPLFNIDHEIDLDKNSVTSFWVSFRLPENIAADTYSIELNCTGKAEDNNVFSIKKNIQLNVRRAVVDYTKYPWLSNWLYIDIPTLGPTVKKLKYLNDNKDVVPFQGDYWDKICSIASFMHDAGQNVILISPQRLATYNYKGDNLLIDFRRFDSMVNCFIKNKVIGRIEGWQICSRAGGWQSNYILHYIKKDSSGNAVFANGQPEDKDVLAFYKVYLPALIQHLKNKGWFKYYCQHIADEPLDFNADSYIRILTMIKTIAPELKTIEAIQTTKVAEYIDIPVPELDYFVANSKYFENLISKGKEVWFYTSFLPQGSYANRFIEQEALMHRLLFWIMARYNVKGMINWGFDYWENQDPYKDLGKKSGQFVLPAGDGFLAYPKKNGLISSIRLETIHDGLNDYALLQSLKQQKPRVAESLMQKVIKNYDSYITDVSAFRAIRQRLLNTTN